MKKLLFTAFLFFAGLTATFAQAKISFDKLVNDLGTFSENDAVRKCTFTFTNTGDKPLVINQATASCGCTIAKYTKTPIKPGEKGTVNVTYNGKGKFPGHFKKSITVRSNGVPMMTRIYIEGVMTETKEK
ncbi:MAG TPA: hypothetical protein DEQ17_06210 [Prevotella sp.]|nr:hypothetical protein [Prevotella sp.]